MRRLCASLLGIALTLAPAVVGAQQQTSFPLIGSNSSQDPSWISENIVRHKAIAQPLVLGATLSYWASKQDLKARDLFRGDGWWGIDLIDVGDAYGDGLYLAGLSGVTWGMGRIAHNPALQKTGQKMVLGLAIDGILVTGIKLAARRRRPDGSDTRSFPSGHTSGAFTVSTILARRQGWKIGVPAYLVASMTAIARMEDHRHYASDVVAGAFLGYAIGRLISPSEDDGNTHIPIEIYSGVGKAGVKISF